MILLDTNVVSELMRRCRDPAVNQWFERQDRDSLAVSTITLAEIQRGIYLLPIGRRQSELFLRFNDFIARAFAIFPFDEKAACAFGPLAAGRVKSGFNTDSVDLMIAAIAQSRGPLLPSGTRGISTIAMSGLSTRGARAKSSIGAFPLFGS